jgi:hypothetical protein
MKDGEQHKDNKNYITKYLELNKDKLLDLAEKNYENLVKALTNNAIDTAGAADSSPSHPTLSLPQSSSAFPSTYDQSDAYRKEQSEIFRNSKRRYC